MKRLLTILSLFVAVGAAAQAADNGFIQQAIDAAPTGAVLRIPAGVYEETITLKDGITLVGEGADATIIDGGGADVVVSSAKNAALMGFTIRNGKTGIHNGGMFIGVFECIVTNYELAAIRIEKGSAAIVNNLLDGSGRGNGVLAVESNPYIGHNVLVRNAVGVYAVHHLIPTIEHNVFHQNEVAIRVSHGAGVALRNNIFSMNRENMPGQDVSTANAIREARPEELAPYRGAELAAYRSLMREVLERAAALQPMVTYDLPETPGRFRLAVSSPWATFRISASAVDSRLVAYDAYDSVTDKDLAAHYLVLGDGRPTVDVDNPSMTEKNLDRYMLEKEYEHPASYQATPDGGLLFERMTNLSRIEVRVPRGYVVAEANPGALVEQAGDRQVVRLTEMGQTVVRLVLRARP
jgi:hypothetical protein